MRTNCGTTSMASTTAYARLSSCGAGMLKAAAVPIAALSDSVCLAHEVGLDVHVAWLALQTRILFCTMIKRMQFWGSMAAAA